jgi:hypothetical protein
MNRQRYWTLFTVIQACGLIVPNFANVHTNPLPLFFGFLLMPGLLTALQVKNEILGSIAAVVVNGLCWWLAYWLFQRLKANKV